MLGAAAGETPSAGGGPQIDGIAEVRAKRDRIGLGGGRGEGVAGCRRRAGRSRRGQSRSSTTERRRGCEARSPRELSVRTTCASPCRARGSLAGDLARRLGSEARARRRRRTCSESVARESATVVRFQATVCFDIRWRRAGPGFAREARHLEASRSAPCPPLVPSRLLRRSRRRLSSRVSRLVSSRPYPRSSRRCDTASPNRRAHLVSVRAAAAYDTTWSNPSGAVLTPLVDDLVWAAERPFLWNSIDVGGKMGVVRLSDGSLWVHSPVDLDSPTRAAVDALGPVRHIVSPNFEHVKWAAQWKRAYPSATLWGCPGMKREETRHPVGRRGGRRRRDPARVARRVQPRVVRQRAQSLRRRRVFQRGGVRARTLANACSSRTCSGTIPKRGGEGGAPRDESVEIRMDACISRSTRGRWSTTRTSTRRRSSACARGTSTRCCRATDRSSRAVPNESFANTSCCDFDEGVPSIVPTGRMRARAG